MIIQDFFDLAFQYSKLGSYIYKIKHHIKYKDPETALWIIEIQFRTNNEIDKYLVFIFDIIYQDSQCELYIKKVFYTKKKGSQVLINLDLIAESELEDTFEILLSDVMFSFALKEIRIGRKTELVFKLAKELNYLINNLDIENNLNN